MKREEVLESARSATCGDRQEDYGEPEENLGRIAKMWSAYLGREVTAGDVAAMLVLVKVSRLARSLFHLDNWIDIAGYAAIGCEATGETTVKPADCTIDSEMVKETGFGQQMVTLADVLGLKS